MSKASLIFLGILFCLATPASADWDPAVDPYKFLQPPDLTTNGIDIKVDSGIVLADDFLCVTPALITDVHLWTSWKNDIEGVITNIHLSIHDDVPGFYDPPDPPHDYVPSHPGNELWFKDIVPQADYVEAQHPGYFTIIPVFTFPAGEYEWWWQVGETAIEEGDQIVWLVNIFIDEDEAFHQQGTQAEPLIYWLDVSVDVEDVAAGPQPEFGWKTSAEHWQDDAVIWNDTQWDDLRYPPGHPFWSEFDVEDPTKGSIDMAFVVTPEPGTMAVLAIGGIFVFCRRRKR
jgi:hypothetical protein